MKAQRGDCKHDRQQIKVVNGKRIQICCACKKTIGKELKGA